MLNNSYLLIDTNALAVNVRTLQGELDGAKLVPVIKDDAYGLGAVPVAKQLMNCGIDTFAVAHVSEGLALRDGGVDAEIWVMSIPLDFQIESAVAADLILTVGNFRQFPVLCEAAKKANKRLTVQLKLDTGLHRIGFREDELPQVARMFAEAAPYLQCAGTFSHFANNETEHMERQYSLFLSMAERLRDLGMDPGLLHISSSASLEANTKYNLDAVRVGRRLYMDHPVNPTGRIREIASLRAYITDIRQRKAGDSLSYGDVFHLPEDTPVGVLSVGYGDGLSPELFDRHAPVLIGGKRAKLLASCMDQSFVDLTGISCRVGDEVTLFGRDADGVFLSSQEVANWIGDNEGCALTGALTTRVARVFR